MKSLPASTFRLGDCLEAALLEGFDCFGIEAEITHVPLVLARIDRARAA